MSDAHTHAHPHGAGHPHPGHAHHAHGPAAGWRYAAAIGLNIAIVVVQVVAGLAMGSTALLADAGHNASDVMGLALAGWAAWLMTRRGSPRRTYGYGKAGVLAALMNSLLLVFACGALAFEAVDRLLAPPAAPPPGGAVMLIAAIAVVVNRRAAVVHLFADAAVSAGVLLAGAIILWTGARWVDPVAGLGIVVVILATTWQILVHSLDMAMDAAPRDLDVAAVRSWLQAQPGVEAVHDLHIWRISATQTALTAHLVVPAGGGDGLLEQVTRGLRVEFDIGHPTLQVERSGCDEHCDGVAD